MDSLPWILLIIAILIFGAWGVTNSKSKPPVRALPQPLSPEHHAEIDALLAKGEQIAAIKRLREVTGLGLSDGKRMIDNWKPLGVGVSPATAADSASVLSATAHAEIDGLVSDGRLIEAIKAYRAATGADLVRAKRVIDNWR